MYIDWDLVDTADYERRVSALEEEGMTRSDAQGCIDVEISKEQEQKTLALMEALKGMNEHMRESRLAKRRKSSNS